MTAKTARAPAPAPAAKPAKAAKTSRPQADKERSRIPYAERKAQILEAAAKLFAERGLSAQTRTLADRCGISQRLLYRFFPNKNDLLAEVYKQNVVGPFKAVWFAELKDRDVPLEQRLNDFYADYLDTVLTPRWLRIFMHSSLADFTMAPDYISSVIKELVRTITEEAAAEQDLALPASEDMVHEIGWTLHGAISHYAIRRHLYRASQTLPQDAVVAMHVRAFLGGFRAMVEAESVASNRAG